MRHALALALLLSAMVSPCWAGETKPQQHFAIARFDFRDTSGEATPQEQKHSTMLVEFQNALNTSFTTEVPARVVQLDCQQTSCSLATAGLAELLNAAKSVSADYLLVGQIHKMSTLVGWVKYALVDVSSGQTVCDRFLTYRGDNEEAWKRAANGVRRDIGNHCLTL